ncbi:MAG TPA: hypothetical protein VF787_07025 [Thermoanaerobaculia bacterium]
MAGRYNDATGLDESSELVQALFIEEMQKSEFSGFTLTMHPTDAHDRHPQFTISTSKGNYQGRIADEDIHLFLSREQLQHLVRAHLLAARDGDFTPPAGVAAG